jgi:Polyketide cyclase / dehydrase and lipid transport
VSHVKSLSRAEEFNAPADAVWKLLLDWAAIIDWMPDGYIRELHMDEQCPQWGPGAIRHIVTGNGVTLSERLDRADESSGELELSLVGPLPWGLLSYRARGKLDVLPEQRCRLTWSSTLEMPQPGIEADRVAALLEKSYAKMFLGIRHRVEARVTT